jgi:hypothetical protein
MPLDFDPMAMAGQPQQLTPAEELQQLKLRGLNNWAQGYQGNPWAAQQWQAMDPQLGYNPSPVNPNVMALARALMGK